jgi:large subunit ribosomal protein L32
MAVPKKRVSITRRRTRQANMQFKLPALVFCSCGNLRRPHCVCDKCGRYKGIQVLRLVS